MKPVLIYDGDCGFCQKTARLVQTWANGGITIAAWQSIPAEMAALGLSDADGRRQAWFVDADGRLSGGAAAVNAALKMVWWARPWASLYPIPGIREVQNAVYAWVAANRHLLPGTPNKCQLD